MPDLPSRRLAVTSCALFPMLETIPMPVTTTRLMAASLSLQSCLSCVAPFLSGRLLARAEQSHLHVAHRKGNLAIRLDDTVGHAEHQLAVDDALQVDDIFELFHGGRHHGGELHFADAERAALALSADPAEEETEQLPHAVEPEAARHHRIAFEVAAEKPEVGL